MRKKIPCLLLVLTVALLLGAVTIASAAQSPQVPLAGSAIPQFMQELPTLQTNAQSIPKIQTVFGNQALTLTMCEFNANVLPPGTPLAAGAAGTTTVWGYIVGTTCPTGPQDTYIGPVIVNDRAGAIPSPTSITFVNNLGNAGTSGALAWKYATDMTLMWADPLNDEANGCAKAAGFPAFGTPCAQNYDGPIPAVAHLHGGEVPPNLDGGPDAWFTSDGAVKGHGYYSFAGAPANGALYKYPNTQEAAPIWFHDHVLGITRLNVYMGLAGAYYIQDPAIIPTNDGGTCTTNCLPVGLHALGDVVPLVIQDRMFDTNGQLFFPADTAGGVLWTTNPEHPYWVPEFVGDTIVVNGKVWPFLTVEAKRYRFLFVNGSNARTYELFLANLPMYVIATDGGYLDAPVPVQKLVIMPGERYEVIIDFANLAGTNLIMKNTGRTPYPKGATPQGSTVGRIMQFRVVPVTVADTSYNPAALPVVPLRTGGQLPAGNQIVRLPGAPGGPAIVTTPGTTQNVQLTRQLTLNEVMALPSNVIDPVTGVLTAYPGGPLMVLVNNTMYDGERVIGVDAAGMKILQPIPGFSGITVGTNTTYYSELPQEGDTEVWEIVNLTADAHPIHLHLVQFQIISRQNYNVNNYTKAYAAAFPAGYDFVLKATVGPGVFIPGYGPPLDYTTGNARALGGNPDIIPFLQGKAVPPLLGEQGWKDTVISYPGQVIRLAVRWAPTDLAVGPPTGLYFPFDPSNGIGEGHGYVWHCHIIDHEDNEMMRPTKVLKNMSAPAPRPLQMGVDY